MKKLILFVVCFVVGCLNVSALENDSNVYYEYIDNIYSNRQIGEEFYTGEQGIVYVNGRLAYCLDATLTLKENTYSSSTDFSIRGIDENTLNYLETVSHFGYGYEGRTDKKYYLAAQEIIWEYLSGGDIYWTDGKGGEVLDISYYKSEILTSMNEYLLLSPNIPTYIETYQNEDIILEDNNNVLKYYETDSWLATINTNTITLNAEFKGKTKFKLKKQPLSYMTSYIYYCEDSQTLATFGYSREQTDEIEITYKVKNRSKISIVKKDLYNDKVIKNRETKIRIYDVNKGNYIVENGSDIFVIGSSGTIELEQLYDEGEYQIEEIEAPLGYKKETVNYTFNIYEYDSDIKTVTLYNEPMRYDININKKQEMFIGTKDTIDGIKGEYTLENANDVIYGLYALENIYDTNGELLYEKDELISELAIKNGKAQYIGLRYGNYYLKELNCPDEYELDLKITTLSLTDENYIVYLDFTNYLKKGDMLINKVNNELGLSDAEFNIYGENYLSNTKLISNALGIVTIKEVPYDTYHLTEVKAPHGYILDSEEKILMLNTSNLNYIFENEKEQNIEIPINPEEPKDPELDIPQEEPSTPELPDTPKEPDAPVVPEEPEIPIQPENPENPISPPSTEKNDIPDVSIVPEDTILPNKPETPEIPSDELEKPNDTGTGEELPDISDENLDFTVNNPSTAVLQPSNSIFNLIICIFMILGLKYDNNKY